MARPTQLVQLTHPDEGRRTALVNGGELHLLATYRSVYEFAMAAIETEWKLCDLVSADLSGVALNYDDVYMSRTPWRFCAAFDHPHEPACCLVAAVNRDGWSYHGSGDRLHAHSESLCISESGEIVCIPEIAAAYVIAGDGLPRRVGLAAGIRGARGAALGPELIVDSEFGSREGFARISRDHREVRATKFSSNELQVEDALKAVEPIHFQRAGHRRRGDAHVIFFGAMLFGALECAAIENGDQACIEISGLGRPLEARMVANSSTKVTALPL